MWQTWQKLDKCDPLGPFRSTPWPPEVEPTNSSCYCRFLSMVFWSLTAFKLRTWAKKSFLHPSCPIHRHIVTFCRSFTDKNALPTEADTCNLVQTQAYDLWRVTMTFITLPTFTERQQLNHLSTNAPSSPDIGGVEVLHSQGEGQDHSVWPVGTPIYGMTWHIKSV